MINEDNGDFPKLIFESLESKITLAAHGFSNQFGFANRAASEDDAGY